jgi:hypothetical protein
VLKKRKQQKKIRMEAIFTLIKMQLKHLSLRRFLGRNGSYYDKYETPLNQKYLLEISNLLAIRSQILLEIFVRNSRFRLLP